MKTPVRLNQTAKDQNLSEMKIATDPKTSAAATANTQAK